MPNPPSETEKSSPLFGRMIARPLPFLVLFPILWIIFCGVGWSKDDKVEEEVNNIWTQQRSSYSKDKEYAENLGKNDLGGTVFAALAASRDGENLFTEARLNEIRARMRETEATTIEYKENTFSWQDICASNSIGLGTAYKFPCARISPMDFFQESRWFFGEEDRVTWYTEVVRKQVLKPRLERFGILQGVCSTLTGTSERDECDHVIKLRNSEAYAVAFGYPPEYADPLGLFADIGNLELNDECKICIEAEFEDTMASLQFGITSTFQVMYVELQKSQDSNPDSELVATLVEQVASILASLDRQAVIDYFAYSVVRALYAEIGAPTYVESYKTFAIPLTLLLCQILGQSCPPNVTVVEAKEILFRHADNAFSSVNTAGIPIPFWSEGDGTGYLFNGTEPVGGSGIDLSGIRLSSAAYLDLGNYGEENWAPLYVGDTADPNNDPGWRTLVETDPVFRWFIAGETKMTAHCGNGDLPGTNTGNANYDDLTADSLAANSQRWCTIYNTPYEDEQEDQTRTVQHFARMWYDLLVDSPSFLNLKQGESDPYLWTTGQGCGYSLGGQRYPYTTQVDANILANASGELYYIDEGETLGAIDRNLLIGGASPIVGEYSYDNPLQKVEVIQTVYPGLLPRDIVDRVKNCNRPGGSVDITLEDAEEILRKYKEAFEETWTKDWDNENEGKVQFVGFFDDSGVVGTTGRLLRDITLDNGTLVAISIIIIAVFSALFLLSFDLVESKVLITITGVGLVILAFFAAVGFGLMIGIKINITIAWTLPFILLGLGVDDMYIVLLAIKKQKGYTQDDFIVAMKEVIVPVSMTSFVNGSMFAVMNISDIPAVYLTAQVALIAVVFLYLTIIVCFPAWCWLDLCRQAEGRYDILVCKKDGGETHEPNDKVWSSFIYDDIYKPLILGSQGTRVLSHSVIWIGAAVLFGLGVWGLTEREVGLGLEDFFPVNHQANRWATLRTEELASWSIQMNWGELDYSDPDTQMQMIKQFEDVVATAHVSEVDTKRLWMADFVVWTTRQCNENFSREDPEEFVCGRDQLFDEADSSTCSGAWMSNTYALRQKIFAEKDTCVPFEEGICRPSSQMHPLDLDVLGVDHNDTLGVWCPVFENWSDEKMEFCLRRWREVTGGSGKLILEDDKGTPTDECDGEYLDDEEVLVPIPYSAGPTMYSYGLYSHEITLDMLEETRAICDDHPELHCWLTGIPYDYWSQYDGIFNLFLQLGGTSVAIGFVVSFFFLFFKATAERHHTRGEIIIGSLVGSFLIAVTTMLSLIAVSGLSILANVNLTGFSNMSFVLSVGFAVEYSVHIVARWLHASPSLKTSLDRVEYTMSFLMLPTFMSFVSSTIGVACLAFTDFEFNKVFFFRPLIIVMFVTYFYGCWWLPVALTLLDFRQVKLGVPEVELNVGVEEVAAPDKVQQHAPDKSSNISDAEDVEDSKKDENVLSP